MDEQNEAAGVQVGELRGAAKPGGPQPEPEPDFVGMLLERREENQEQIEELQRKIARIDGILNDPALTEEAKTALNFICRASFCR